MRLSEIYIGNFRGLRDQSLFIDRLASIIGPNGVGKSTFLHALLFFYDHRFPLSQEDYFGNDLSDDIRVSCTFTALSEEARTVFQSYLSRGDLTITKRATDTGGGTFSQTYHGGRLAHQPFEELRAISGFRERQRAYNNLREGNDNYATLPAVRGGDELDGVLLKWELEHSSECTRIESEVKLLGYREVAIGKISQFSRLIYVPAVREAVDEASAAIKELKRLIIRPRIQTWERFQELKANLQSSYSDTIAAPDRPDLSDVGCRLTQLLSQYMTGTEVRLEWNQEATLAVPEPEATLTLTEHEFEGSVERKGHGLQRSFILSLLQYLAEEPSAIDPNNPEAAGLEDSRPLNYILAIEEPELYQHPLRCSVLARTLQKIAAVHEDAPSALQVLYTSHSPYFLDFSRFADIRIARKLPGTKDGGIPDTTIAAPRKLAVHHYMRLLRHHFLSEGMDVYTLERFELDLQRLMNVLVNQGFFAKRICLVEGETDKAALLALATYREIDLDRLGILIVPVGGKTSIPLPVSIFRSFDIDCFLLFDGDGNRQKQGHPEWNRVLCWLAGRAVEDWPTLGAGQWGACFSANLETYLSEQIGKQRYVETAWEIADSYGIPSKEGRKKGAVVGAIVEQALNSGIEFPLLEALLDMLLNPAQVATNMPLPE